MDVLNGKIDYALRALITLKQSRRAVSTRELSERCGVALALMRQIMHELGKAGRVKSERGSGGGFRIARLADEITFKEVIRIMQGDTIAAQHPITNN